MNKLKTLFSNDSTRGKRFEEAIQNITAQLKDAQHCMFCIYSEQHPHYELSCEAGTDTYCTIRKELRLYPDDTGQQCLFWEERENA